MVEVVVKDLTGEDPDEKIILTKRFLPLEMEIEKREKCESRVKGRIGRFVPD